MDNLMDNLMDMSYSHHIEKIKKAKLSSKCVSYYLASALFCRESTDLSVHPFRFQFMKTNVLLVNY